MALQQMQERANSDLTAALAVRVNQLFASFNQKFEASRREETRKTDEAIRLMKEENAGLRKQMLTMEAVRLEQDRKMGMGMEGIMAGLGGLPLPDAGVMTPPRGGVGSNVTQQWQHPGVEMMPAQYLLSTQVRHHTKPGNRQQQTVVLLQGRQWQHPCQRQRQLEAGQWRQQCRQW